jgi:glucokinase
VILAGDIGGTKTVLALFEGEGTGLRRRSDATFPSGEHGSLEEILTRFLEDQGRAPIEAACCGVAGAVIGGRVKTTNLPWQLDEATLARCTGARRASLLNDLEATAYGMLVLDPEDRALLNRAAEPGRMGNAAVLAAGTGLGEAILFWDGERHRAIASEGGHTGFAPRNDREIALLRFLRAELGGRVSIERVLSGPGLHGIYRFMRQSGPPEPSWLGEQMTHGDPSAVVAEAALADRDPVCADALGMFVSIYGAEAGDLALKCLAVGGVFVGGGIAPKILPALRSGAFLRSFTDKGRFSELLSGFEVSVSLNPHTALLGAAQHAARLAGRAPMRP